MNAVKSGLISISGSVIQQSISLVGTLVLARLLSPTDYGIYALCFTTFVFFQAFLDFGITPIYIKLDYVDKTINSSFFAVNVLFGGMISIILIVIAPFFANYFELPELKSLLYVQAVIPLLQSISNQPFGQLLRSQKFVSAEITSVGSGFVAMSIGITLALMGFGPWALMYKHMAFNISRITAGFWFSKARYSLVSKTDLLNIKRYIVQASHLTLSRFATGISGNIEKLIVGKVFGEASLGHYNQGLFVTEKPYAFSNALTTPAMSYLARMNPKRYGESYQMITKLIILFIGLPCLFFFLYGSEITTLILGDKWEEAGSYVVYLSFLGLSLIIKSLCNIILVNESKTDKLLSLNLWCILFVYPVTLYTLFTFNSLLLFVQLFSGLSLLYWFFTLCKCIYQYTTDNTQAIRSIVFLFTMISIFLVSGYMAKTLLLADFGWNIWLEAISTAVLGLSATLMGLALFFKPELSKLFQFIIQRLH